MCCPGVCGLAVTGTWSGNYVRMTCFEKRSRRCTWRSSESGRTKSTASTDAIRRLFSHKFYARHTSAAADRPIDAPKAPWTKPFSFCMVTRYKNSTMVYQGTFESSLQIAGGAGTSKCTLTEIPSQRHPLDLQALLPSFHSSPGRVPLINFRKVACQQQADRQVYYRIQCSRLPQQYVGIC